MKVNLDILANGQSEEHLEMSFFRFPDDVNSEKITVKGVVTLDNTVAGVLIIGDLDVEGRTDCCNCLEMFTLRYDADVEIFIDREARCDDISDDDWVICQSRGVVDISDSLRDAVLLARPQRVICNEECKGFCAQCGQNLNKQSCDCKTEDVDPRWEALP